MGILYSSKGEEVAIVLGTKKTPVKYASTIFTITQTEEYKIDNTTVDTYFNILKTRTKMNNIIKKFDLDITTQELIESIEIKRLDYSDIIEISITNEKIKDKPLTYKCPSEFYIPYQRWGRQDIVFKIPTSDLRELSENKGFILNIK